MAGSARSALEDDGRICNMQGREATIEDLYQVEDGKAELVGGRVVVTPASGGLESFAAYRLVVSLGEYGHRTKMGYGFVEPGFIVDLPSRRSFCPDVAFTTEHRLTGTFIHGAPIFAVEIRSESDYGRGAERAMAAKRAEYFAAGTLVVWDVDLLREHLVRVYRSNGPSTPTIYRGGEHADAEPALPGWTMAVNDLFPSE